MSDVEDEIVSAVEEDEAFIGTEETIKNLKKGDVKKVFMSLNVPKDIEEDIEYYSEDQDVEIIDLDLSNKELGTICRKPFSISVLSMSK